MVQEGITYQAQGYHTGDGVTVPAWKIDEHMLCARLYGQAQSERNKKPDG